MPTEPLLDIKAVLAIPVTVWRFYDLCMSVTALLWDGNPSIFAVTTLV